MILLAGILFQVSIQLEHNTTTVEAVYPSLYPSTTQFSDVDPDPDSLGSVDPDTDSESGSGSRGIKSGNYIFQD